MLTRKTQFAWMAVGGLICLLGLVLACKLHDGNRAIAQLDPPEPFPTPITKPKDPSPSIFTLPPVLPLTTKAELLPPLKKLEKSKDQTPKAKSAEPKARLEKPLPSEPPPSMPVIGAIQAPAPPPAAVSPPPSAPAPVLSVSFGPNTPTPPPTPTRKLEKRSPTAPYEPLRAPSAAKVTEKKTEPANPNWTAPGTTFYQDDGPKTQPGEPPLAPAPGLVQIYRVNSPETLHDIARRTLGSSERWGDLHKLNPTLNPDEPLSSGTIVRLPGDACIQTDDAEPVKPLPTLRTKPPAPKAKVLPLTGTYQCSLDDKGRLTLPRAIRDQLGGSDTLMLSPGPDKCLWLTDQPHLERLGERLDQSQANEADVRVFKRLYFAQTEKLAINSDGRVTVPERLGQFAGLHQEVVLVGIDDHFEVWDAARWRSYTQQKSTAPSAALTEQE